MKIRVFLIIIFLFVSADCARAQPELRTAPEAVREAIEIVRSFGINQVIPIAFDADNFFSRYTSNGKIFLGRAVLTATPEMLKGIVGHEVAHILNKHHLLGQTGIVIYCICQALVAFLWASGLTLVVDDMFTEYSPDNAANSWTGNITLWAREAGIQLIAPAIIAYYSASVPIFQFSSFALTNHPSALALFTLVYLLAIDQFDITSLRESLNTYMRAVLHFLDIIDKGISTMLSTLVKLAATYLIIRATRTAFFYGWRRIQRSFETTADITGARLFGTGPQLIKYLERLRSLFPQTEIASLGSFHPTSSQRIADIKQALNLV